VFYPTTGGTGTRFPPKAADASRFRPVHIFDGLIILAGDSGGRISGPLANVCFILANGLAPPALAQWIAGSFLFPLKKRDGGVRPIAVGEVLRRLVSKLMVKKLCNTSEMFVEVDQFDRNRNPISTKSAGTGTRLPPKAPEPVKGKAWTTMSEQGMKKLELRERCFSFTEGTA